MEVLRFWWSNGESHEKMNKNEMKGRQPKRAMDANWSRIGDRLNPVFWFFSLTLIRISLQLKNGNFSSCKIMSEKYQLGRGKKRKSSREKYCEL